MIRITSWEALHMMREPEALGAFVEKLPMQDYIAVRNWLDRVIRLCYEDALRDRP